MKKQFLFGALLCGAMLASCSVNDDLTAEVAPVNQSPVFTVTLEDEFAATRADMGLGNAKISFVEGDKMTLYHGAATTALTGYENAVYEGFAGAEEGTMSFTTRAMVKKDYAVMVFPADLTFANAGTAAPVIGIELANQTEETANNTPYVSEVLKIGKYNSEKPADNATAGYGRTYDLSLKRLAATVLLTLKEDGEFVIPSDVAPLEVTGVEIKANGFFTKDVTLSAGTEINDKNAYGKKHPIWKNNLDATAKTKADAVKTKYIAKNGTNDMAVFTLLPFAVPFVQADNVEVVVYTNYGSVTINGTTKKVWSGDAADVNKDGTIKDGLNALAPKLYGEVGESSVFYDKDADEQTNVGKGAKRTLSVDFSTINMDGTHITTSEQLIDVLKVYDYLVAADEDDEFNKDVTFYLDGDKDGKFYMNEAALKAYAAHIGKTSEITFTPCTEEGEECDTIVLTTAASAAAPAALDFGGEVVVELEGAWTLAGEYAYNKVTEIVVPKGSTVTVNADIKFAAKTDNYRFAPAAVTVADGITVADGGNVAVAAGKTVSVFDFKVTNYGTITVPANSALLMNAVTLENSYVPAKKTGYANKGAVGTISVSGRLAVANNGKINNFGLVSMDSAAAVIYLTNNATTGASYGVEADYKDGTNVIGSVKLYDATANSNVNIAGEQGFIKLYLNGTADYTVTDAMLGKIANYVVVDGPCVAYDALTVGEDETVQNNIKYVEFNSTKEVKMIGRYNNASKHFFEGMAISKDANVNIPTGSQVTVINFYLQGYLYDAGLAWNTGVNYKTYFGEGDKNHYAYTGTK